MNHPRVAGGLVVVALLAVLASCGHSNSGTGSETLPRDTFLEGVTQDIAAYLPLDADTRQLTEASDLLFEPHPGRRGEGAIDGVWGVSAEYGTMVLYVEMLPGESDVRKHEVVAILDGAPGVLWVETDAVVTFTMDYAAFLALDTTKADVDRVAALLADGPGDPLVDGVRYVRASYANRMVYVEMTADAIAEQRARVVELLESDPAVTRIEEDSRVVHERN